jgi:hypothetical protein
MIELVAGTYCFYAAGKRIENSRRETILVPVMPDRDPASIRPTALDSGSRAGMTKKRV